MTINEETMNNLICNRQDDVEALVLYIDKPVYVRGYCWGKKFDGWVVIYDGGGLVWPTKYRNLVFDYRGKTYSAFGFLPFSTTWPYSSSDDNAFYKSEGDA